MVNETVANNEKVAMKYNEICDFFMIGANDDMRKKSDAFFKFFTAFIDDVQKVIPKPVKASKKKAVDVLKGAVDKKAGAKAAQSAMMAEMMAKQAANKK